MATTSRGGGGWSRNARGGSVPTPPPPQKSFLQQLNFWSKDPQSVRLPETRADVESSQSSGRLEEFDSCFGMSDMDRKLLFAGLNLAAVVMFLICGALIPTGIFVLRPRKFVILWTMGSVLFISSWAVWMGPVKYAMHLFSGPRVKFTAIYFGSIGLTIYSAMILHSTVLTIAACLVQLAALVWYLASYAPVSLQGLQWIFWAGSQAVRTTAASWV